MQSHRKRKLNLDSLISATPPPHTNTLGVAGVSWKIQWRRELGLTPAHVCATEMLENPPLIHPAQEWVTLLDLFTEEFESVTCQFENVQQWISDHNFSQILVHDNCEHGAWGVTCSSDSATEHMRPAIPTNSESGHVAAVEETKCACTPIDLVLEIDVSFSGECATISVSPDKTHTCAQLDRRRINHMVTFGENTACPFLATDLKLDNPTLGDLIDGVWDSP